MKKNIKIIAASAFLSASFILGSAVPAFAADKYVKVAGEPVVVRKDAGKNYTVIAKTHKNDEYEYISEKKDANGVTWYQIKLSDGKTGWMTSELSKTIEKNTPSVSDKQVEIIGEPVNVRADAGTSYKALAKVHKGNKFAYIESKNDKSGKVWYKIEYKSGKYGWVMGSLAKVTGTQSGSTDPDRKLADYTGTFQHDRASLTVEAISATEAKITVSWANSASETVEWHMSGSFDPDTMRINYSDGEKANYVYNDYGKVGSKTVVYSNGFGRVQFYSTDSLGWYDELEPDLGLMEFKRISEAAPTPSEIGKTVEIIGEPVNVRENAGTSNKSLAKVHKGNKFTCLGVNLDNIGKQWYKIEYASGKYGWVMGTLTKLTGDSSSQPAPAPAPVYGKTVEIIGEPVVVRADAGTSNKVISKVHKGNKFAYIESKNDKGGKVWYKIEYTSGKYGWVMGTLAKVTDGSAVTVTKKVEIIGNPVNVRADASLSAKKLGRTEKGKTFTYLDSKKDASGQIWYKIQFTDSTVGWVLGTLAKVVEK